MIVSIRNFSLIVAGLGLLFAGVSRAKAAESYITIDATTSYVLDKAQPDKKRQVGSLTKIATAMVVLDWAATGSGDLAQVAIIPESAFVGANANNIGFQPGDTITLRDLLYAALVQSDNIAAYTLAKHVGTALLGTAANGGQSARTTPVDYCVLQMNVLAKRLGMNRTRFLNPHGQDDKERPYSTAADMARLARYAMNNAGFRFYVSQRERQISFGRGPQRLRYLVRNTNELLGINAIDGVKTGQTERAGQCLILSAGRPAEIARQGETTLVTPRRLIVVLLDSPNRFGEGAQLLERGWQLYDQWSAGGRVADPKELLAPAGNGR